MAATVADLRAKIEVQGAEKAKKDLKDVKGKSGKGGDGILGLSDAFKSGLGMVTGFFAGFSAVNIATDALGFLKDQLGDILEQGMSQQKVMAQTAAVIKSTGGAAHVSADQVGDLADKLARLTGTSDDEIQSAENILLTFSRINKDAFPRATELTLDLATAMHEDLNSASIQVGKALNDPIQGVTALRRVGVQLSQQQEDAVRHFMAVGDVASAQKVIMDELAKEVGGSAEAYGQTFPGQVARFNVALDQAKEKIGLAVLPVLSDLLQKYVLPLASALGQILPQAIQATTDFFNTQLKPAIDAFMATPFGQTLQGWADSLIKNVNPAVDSKTGLSGATNNATGSMQNLQDQAGKTGGALDPNYTGKVGNAVTKTNTLTDAIDPKGAGDKSSHALAPAMRRADDELDKLNKKQQQANQSSQGSIPVLSGLGEAFGNLAGKAGEAVANIGGFVDDVKQRFPDAEPAIQRGLSNIGDDFSMFTDGVHHVWDGFWGVLATPVKLAFHTVEGIVKTGLDILGGHWDQAEADTKQTQENIKNDLIDWGKSLGGILQGIAEMALGWLLAPFKELWRNTQPFLQQFGYQVIAWFKQNLPWFPGIGNLKFPVAPGNGQAGPGYGRRASGGPVSGDFIGAEEGMELLVTPGLYHAPPGSYVYNNSQTRAMMQRNGNGIGGNTYTYNIYPQQATIDTQELARIQRRRDLLNGLYS